MPSPKQRFAGETWHLPHGYDIEKQNKCCCCVTIIMQGDSPELFTADCVHFCGLASLPDLA